MALPKRLRSYLKRQDQARERRRLLGIRKGNATQANRSERRTKCRSCGNVKPAKQEGEPRPAPTTLLTLPAELRNRIYEYTLANEITPHVMARNLNRMPPPWLLSCKQIYNEAVKIWFYVSQKHTVIEIDDLDARPFIYWTKRRQELKVPFNDPPVHCRASYNWKNLLAWAKAVWEAKSYWELSPSNGGVWSSETNHIAWSALELAADYHDLPWQDCEHALGTLRNAISVYEPRWGGYFA